VFVVQLGSHGTLLGGFDVDGANMEAYVVDVNTKVDAVNTGPRRAILFVRMSPRKPKVSTKPAGRYHHGDLKGGLVAAGLEMLDEVGPSAVSTRSLARRLGVSHAAPSRHFPDRVSLLAEVAAAAFDAFAVALEAGRDDAANKTPMDALVGMGRAYVRFAVRHPGYLRLMFSHELTQLEAGSEHLTAAGARAYDVLVQSVRAALGARATEERVQVGSFLCWSQVHGAAALWLDGPLRHSLPARGAEAAFLRMADASTAALSRALAAL
jgi:AcrR family transcriptional regulator